MKKRGEMRKELRVNIVLCQGTQRRRMSDRQGVNGQMLEV